MLQSDFKDYGPQPRAPAPPPPAMKPHVPFDGTTTARDAFKLRACRLRACCVSRG